MRDEKGQIQGKFITVINMFIKLIWLIQGDCIICTEIKIWIISNICLEYSQTDENAEQESTRKSERNDSFK
jgi:hypothetical protein